MSFSLEKLFVDVFAPQKGEVVTIMYDLPHGNVSDTPEWQDRRLMAEEWQATIGAFADKYGMRLEPVVTYEAAGAHGMGLPEYGLQQGRKVRLEDVARDSTIIISMPQFSASAALLTYCKTYPRLRAASMPTVKRSMQETGLSADLDRIAELCAKLAPLFDRADGIEVSFSTGDVCYFDKSDHKPAESDDGRLHPSQELGAIHMTNLPCGEVFVVPNESPASKTKGRIPVSYAGELVLFDVDHNHIIDVHGDGPVAARMRTQFHAEPAMGNIAEVAIGCNEKAVVTGNVLEDEKAGFHWAYGRSDHLGGTVGPAQFSAPERVVHQDTVYAKGNPVICQRLDFVFPDGTRKTAITDGVLLL